jgi:hypothetical protein
MPITPTNLDKNAITPNSVKKSGYATWGDDVATWGDSVITWGAPSFSMVNRTKNSITPNNLNKN